MDLNDLTLGQIQRISSMFTAQSAYPDKIYGWIVLILRNGFVFVGDTRRENGIGYLQGANVRYWETRGGGLPALAQDGPLDGDKIDKITGELEFPWNDINVIGVYPCNAAAWRDKV